MNPDLSKSPNTHDWLLAFAIQLASRKWLACFHSLIQMDPFDENGPNFSTGHLSDKLGRDWTAAVGQVILTVPEARTNLIRMAARDLRLHKQADENFLRFGSQSAYDAFLRDNNAACAEAKYAGRIHKWLKDLRRPPVAQTGLRATMVSRILDDMMDSINSGEKEWVRDLLRTGYIGLNNMEEEKIVQLY